MIRAYPRLSCKPEFWSHVYKPERFTILAQCVTVEGVIEHRRHEPDADWHEHLALDAALPIDTSTAEFAKAWARNMAKQNGDLVIEPICISTVKQADAKKPCKGAPQIKVPVVGDHVRVTGVLVIDNGSNHGWVEIHASTTMEVVP